MLVVITNGGMKLWGDEIANIEAIGVECSSLIVAIQILLHIANRDQPIAVEGPTIGYRLCIQCNLLEANGFLVGDVHARIGITRFQ